MVLLICPGMALQLQQPIQAYFGSHYLPSSVSLIVIFTTLLMLEATKLL